MYAQQHMSKILQAKWYYILAVAMLLLTFLDWIYWFYQVLRWAVSGTAIFIGYQNYQEENMKWFWTFLIIAILFNPISPIHLERELWSIIDIIVAVVYLTAFFKDSNKSLR